MVRFKRPQTVRIGWQRAWRQSCRAKKYREPFRRSCPTASTHKVILGSSDFPDLESGGFGDKPRKGKALNPALGWVCFLEVPKKKRLEPPSRRDGLARLRALDAVLLLLLLPARISHSRRHAYGTAGMRPPPDGQTTTRDHLADSLTGGQGERAACLHPSRAERQPRPRARRGDS